MTKAEDALSDLMSDLRATDSHEAQEELGRAVLAGLLLYHSGALLDHIL